MLVAVLCLIRNSHHFLFGLKLFKSGKDPEPHSQAIFEAAFMASRGAKSACGQDNHPPNHPPNRPNHPNHPTTHHPIGGKSPFAPGHQKSSSNELHSTGLGGYGKGNN